MNSSIETNSDHNPLLTPRTSLQNIGEKQEDEESNRTGKSFRTFGADGFTFLDFLDIVNPLQHIPFVGTVYRSITNDEIDPGSRIAGAGLFGGPIGTVIALANVTIEQNTGQDIGNHMMAFVTGDNVNNSKVDADIDLPTSHQSPNVASVSSPISTNAEVLEWAKKETAHSVESATKAQLQSTPLNASHISKNLDVMNWARKEAALIHSNNETATIKPDAKSRQTEQARLDEHKSIQSTNIALGRDQRQLSGSISPNGAWFSETMLLALARYGESAQLVKTPAEKRSVETTEFNN